MAEHGMAFYIYWMLNDDQSQALRAGPFKETARPYWPPLKPATPRRESVSRLWALHRNAHSSLNKRAGQQEAEFALRRAAPKKSFPMPPDTAVCNAKPVEKILSIVRRAGYIWKLPRAGRGEGAGRGGGEGGAGGRAN